MFRGRFVALAVAAMMLALPAVALAALHFLHGPVGSGAGNAGVEIHFVVKGGKPVKIKLFGFFNVPYFCPGFGNSAVSGQFPHAIKVSQQKFHSTQTVRSGATTYIVKGKFGSLHKATGTLRIKGTVPGCSSMDTGALKWRATP